MKLSEIKFTLDQLSEVQFKMPNGEAVPQHFHITEVGVCTKRFIDCGGTLRNESIINFQLFTAEDFDHRLGTDRLKSIIEIAEKRLGLEDLEIEVEYQKDTIGKYHLEFNGNTFLLIPTQTDCLAMDNCGIPIPKPQKSQISSTSCAPGSGCC